MSFCINLEAKKSVTGVKALHRIYSSVQMRALPLKASVATNNSMFAVKLFDSIERIKLFMPRPREFSSNIIELYAAQTDTPALIGMDALDKEGLVADTVANRLTNRVKVQDKQMTDLHIYEWSVPLIKSQKQARASQDKI